VAETSAADLPFVAWPLHDAVVGPIVLDPEDQTCRLDLDVFFESGEDARPATVEWTDVTGLAFSHEAPWGRSAHVYVNRQWREGERVYVLELQTGDEVRVTAGSASLHEHRAV
jgi:hypothetical protein